MRAVIAGWALLPAAAALNALGGAPARIGYVVATCAFALVPLVLATLVARRAPGNPCAVWLAAAGVALVVTAASDDLGSGVLAGSWMLLYLPFAILLLTVPSGRVRSRAWLRVGWALTIVVLAFIAVCAAQALAPAAREPLTAIGIALLPLFLAGLIACALAPVVRYRHATPSERMQLRWVFLSGMSLPLTLLLCWTSYLVTGTADLVGFGLGAMYLAIPIGVTIGILRPDLIDIDRASIATITATLLSAAALAVLSIVCLVVGTALVTWSPLIALSLTAALAAAVALSFRPLYRFFDRLVFPERGRALAAIARLHALVEAGRAEPADIEETLRESLRDPGLEVAYVRLSDGALIRLDGARAGTTGLSAPIRFRSEVIGALTASPVHGRRPSASVAKAAAPLLDRARLHAELDAARADVAASRERLVRASFEEQRRLERDLHDGAQQRLVALGMRLRVLQRSAELPARASDDLDAAVAELGTAVAELRRLAHGVRPSALDDGLPAALGEIAARVPGVELDVRIPEIPDDIAITTYFVVSEAVANALKHAGAERIRVVVASGSDALRVTIDDDGCGGALPSGGLTHLSDRVGALGGDLSIVSPAGEGTRIEVTLPCAS